ncbi:hypothetical protein KWK59_019030 [Clostridioides difficile]|uniref:hypothetical protein n=1 Tax=Clostridioides difficile TaxID=1496 RepID=UPI000D1F7857|nr:hypothetical protein [Clostridioides difficile]MCA0540235.1 hypothetical protein [Clostridioides difficile]MDL5068772.1 hypothetical protein [Clostridioides difficile]MDS6334017.1 hypothetical protein [Clostridioides difficile]HBF7900808.1 hypothetical protein [Clostridioides difficile]
MKEKIENDLNKSDKNQILKQLEELEIAKWNYNREIREIRDLKESNKDINIKYEELKRIIGSIGNETKETKKKRRIATGMIIWLVISAYMSLSDDIDRIKSKIIREHG